MEEESQNQGPEAPTTENNSEALYNAVAMKDVTTLQQLLSQGANADMFYDDDHNISSKSILHIACGKGCTDCVKALLEAGAMPDIHDKWGQTPLHYCICVQFMDTAQTLLDHQGDKACEIVNSQDGFGKSCLHVAAESTNVEAIEMLINHGADVNIRNFDGVTPLMICAESCGRSKSVRSLEMLMEAGAMIDLTDYRSRRSALQRAAVAKNVAAVELLLSVGVEVDSLDITRRTALTNIMWDHVRNRQGACHIDPDVMTIIVLLTQAGANLDLAVCEYSNPLVTASFLQAAPLLRFFLDQGAQPNVAFSSGVTPLLVATSKKDVECVKTLLNYNCCMTMKGRVFRKRLNTEYTFDPIEMALDDGSFHLLQVFLAAGYQAGRIGSQLLEKLKKTESDGSNPAIDSELRQWLMTRILQPPSLRELTIYKIRCCLDQRLHKVVPLLPLPSRVKDSILMINLFT